MNDRGTTERSSLISSNNTVRNGWIKKLKNRYSKSWVTSRRAILCLIWLGLGMCLRNLVAWFSWITLVQSDLDSYKNFFLWGNHNISPGHDISRDYDSLLDYCLLLAGCEFVIACSYFFWPLLGYIGERYTRYYIIMTGVVVSCLTTIVLLIMMLLDINHYDMKQTNISVLVSNDSNEQIDQINISVAVICLFIHNIGFGCVAANIIQFSIDQDPHASSEEIASYTRWWVFTFFSAQCVAFLIASATVSVETCSCYKIIILVLPLVLCIVYILFGFCFKHYFIIEPPPTVDPLKLMYRVLKYAWKHKSPERRSAFTYSDDPPSRLDYGKDRYGGPFTTDQVESVRSFWYILAVIVCIGVSSYQLKDLSVFHHKLSINQTCYYVHPLLEIHINMPFEMQFSEFILVFVPPIFQLILIPLFPCLVPGMLKRMWFSSLLAFPCSIIITVVHLLFIFKDYNNNHIILAATTIIGSIGSAIIGFTSLEFVFAQGPVTFQGVLIGIWSVCINGKFLIFLIIWLNMSGILPTFLQCVSLIVFSIVMYHYKYRLRNELSDINRRQTVEEIYERDLRQRSIAETSFNDSEDFSVYDVN